MVTLIVLQIVHGQAVKRKTFSTYEKIFAVR